MQALFKEIKAGDIDAVRRRLEKDPGAVALRATPPPKTHAGQQPLMVALMVGEFEIADLLLDFGADVNDDDSAAGEPHWRPVLFDAIRAAAFRTRPRHPTMRGPVDTAAQSLAVLRRMLQLGADPTAVNSGGTSALMNAAGDVEQVLPPRQLMNPDVELDPEFDANITALMDVLLATGVDPHRIEPIFDTSVADWYDGRLIGRYLRLQREA